MLDDLKSAVLDSKAQNTTSTYLAAYKAYLCSSSHGAAHAIAEPVCVLGNRRARLRIFFRNFLPPLIMSQVTGEEKEAIPSPTREDWGDLLQNADFLRFARNSQSLEGGSGPGSRQRGEEMDGPEDVFG